MDSTVIRAQEVAIVVIAIAVIVIAVAAPFATLGPSATWRARVAEGLMMLDALIAVVRRVLGA
jgi:hypothetical protein